MRGQHRPGKLSREQQRIWNKTYGRKPAVITPERLTLEQRRILEKTHGLGVPLGKGPAGVLKANWIKRKNQWDNNRAKLEAQFPRIFSNEFFNMLPYLGGRSEGEVRLFTTAVPFTTFYEKAGALHKINWYKFAIKKFKKRAVSNPENQARTLHSLNAILNYFRHNNMLPKFPFEVMILEAITYKYPFLVMRFLGETNDVRADKLPEPLKTQVRSAIKKIGLKISQSSQRLASAFREAGFEYPSPDLIMENVMAEVNEQEVLERIWIFDQYTGKRSKSPRFRRESVRRIKEKWK